MAQRTLAEARSVIDQMTGLSPAQQREVAGEVTAAQREARSLADRMCQGRVDDIAAVRDDALAEVCAVRDGFAALKKDADVGRISARDYQKRLHDLQADQRRAERRLADIDQAVEFVAGIEADPIAYAEGVYAKFPLIRPNFSF